MAKTLIVVANFELTDETCKVVYSSLYNSFSIRRDSSMFENDGKCPGANFWGIDKAKSNSFMPCNIAVVEKRLPKDGEQYIDTFGSLNTFDIKVDRMKQENVIVEMTEEIEKRILDDIYTGKVKQGDNVDSYFVKAFPTTDNQMKEILENVIKYCEDKQVYDKLTMYGDFYYKAKKLLKNM